MPGYLEIIESDDYTALRSPSFARGYVRSYGKLLRLNELELLAAFDKLAVADDSKREPGVRPRAPLQLQKTSTGIYVGLGLLLILTLTMWWNR
jgi:cytoskeletal protein RodZ